MDRQTIYPGQVPLETDLLKTNQNVMVALAKLSESIFGTSGIATGFGTTQTAVPSMAVLVAPGEIYSQQNLEASALSSLPQDLTHLIVKQGLLLDPITLPLAAPGTAGFSVNYLVQVVYQDLDSGSAVLPYYNASNPSVAYSGPANSGAAQPTTRQGYAVVSLKAGVAATTGTQATPTPDAGKLGLYVITVANGATVVVNANISPYPGAAVSPLPIARGRLLNIQVLTSTGTYTKTPGATSGLVRGVGGGGGGGGSTTTGGTQCSAGAGGASGSWFEHYFSLLPTTQSYAIGAAGSGGSPGSAGGAGGTTTFGALTAPGGSGGQPAGSVVPPFALAGGCTGSFGSGANLQNGVGATGEYSIAITTNCFLSGRGGASILGGGGAAIATASVNGNPGPSKGSGGSGAANGSSTSGFTGGAGAAGVIFVFEYA